MDTLAKLEAYDDIRTVKARYCRYMDTKDWVGMASIFTEDFVLDVEKIPASRPLSAGRQPSQP